MALADEPEGLHGLFPVGKGVARACNAYDLYILDFLHHLIEIAGGLRGRQDRARYPGPRFVDACVITVAVVALHVALGRHGQVHPGCRVASAFAEAWMIVVIHDRPPHM